MILYNVTVNIDAEVEQEWLAWMKEVHVPDVMATGLFVDSRVYKLLQEEPQGTTYSFQYFAKSLDQIEEYQQKHAPKLQQDVNARYPNKFVAFRSLLDSVD